MAAQKIILFSCGTFNPPTIMHLRMFDLARDYLSRSNVNVVGGVISPVNDLYGKKGMAKGQHRLKMLQLATASSPWIKVSKWEIEDNCWTRTRAVLDHHQAELNNFSNGVQEKASWMPDELERNQSVQLKVLSGADLLESFNVPDLWQDEDAEAIAGRYGMVIITRDGNDPKKSIYKNDILSQYEGNITVVTEWMANEISSTKIRTAIRRSQSIRYFVLDSVLDYIKAEKLYEKEDKEGN